MTRVVQWLRTILSRLAERFPPKRDVWVVAYRNHLGRMSVRSEHPSYEEAVMVKNALGANPLFFAMRYVVMDKENFKAANGTERP